MSERARAHPRHATPEQQLKVDMAMVAYRVDSALQWLPKIKNPGRLLLSALGLSGGTVVAQEAFNIFTNSNTRLAYAAECSIGVFGMGFQYAKDPENLGNPFLIDPYSFHIPGLQDMGETIITIKQGSKPDKVIPISMNPVDGHFETPFKNVSAEPNAANGTAIQFDVSMKDDLVIDPQTKEKPKKTFVATCGKTGWFYVGRVAIADSIDAILKGSATGLNRIGHKIDQAMLKKLGKAPGAAVTDKGDPAQNLASFKAQAAEIKKMSEATKAEELKNGQKPPAANPRTADVMKDVVLPVVGGLAGLGTVVGFGWAFAKRKHWI